MKNKQLITGNYLHKHQKFIVFYLLIITFMGALNFLLNKATFAETLFGLLLLIISYLLFVVMIGKKGLHIIDDKLYLGISISNKLFLKEKINKSNFEAFHYERKHKTNLPGILAYSGMAMFSNYNECIVYLTESDPKFSKRLISLTDFNQYEDVRDFLHRWTKLIERVNKT